jgi:shikimate dehydrogenase
MRKFGLIGYPLSHSFSKGYFTEKFLRENLSDCEYLNFPIDSITKFPEILLKNPELCGLNVTIPYKEQLFPFLDEIDPEAKRIGAINTIKFIQGERKKILKGFNTDVYGFSASLMEIMAEKIDNALILGTGGASKAVAYSLDELGIKYNFVSRKPGHLSYGNIDKRTILEHRLIINTTPLGTFPDVDNCPGIPYDFLSSSHILFDLIYNPAETVFLRKGREKGATTINGLRMLHLQAEKSWEIWNS